jgi:hypothetical protein
MDIGRTLLEVFCGLWLITILNVQERLGHARGSITLDVYGRVLAGRRAEGTRRMSAVMQSSNIAFTLADSELPS